MTDFETGHEQVDRLPFAGFLDAAIDARTDLTTRGSTAVRLLPGDSTVYTLTIVHPPIGGGTYYVAMFTPQQGAYEWRGDALHRNYVQTKWGIDEWTAAVLARFLAVLADELAGVPS